MNKLQILAIERIIELGQEAYLIHQDLSKWRSEPYTDLVKTEKSVELKSKLEQQRFWCNALLEESEEVVK
ncbi:hypothetical protein C4577_02265 [Candidatus Parcubacteria bacterium]|nr:MAG: hypothetical protein C4577_02265 [Candidatus Parcubacteria bacterium]